ncbi:MAG: class I SAM-dependent methyltransferase [Arenimonas sp.]|nr:class I SAM-dependent methyltransferase [Arenimonas sp.]
MQTVDEEARRSAWSAYWAAGQLHSCVGSLDAGYGGAIGQFWAQQFRTLGASDRVLDLATGNGPLPRLLSSTRDANDCPHVDAVDLAQIAPAWYTPADYPRIRFHSGVRMESLPFPDGHFTLIVSQFGFEYAHREPALRECLRVLAPGGRMAFVMHHAGSVLAKVGRSELAIHERLLEAGGLLDAASGVLPWFARARAGEDLRGHVVANASRSAYNAAISEVTAYSRQLQAPDLAREAVDQVHRIIGSAAADPGPALAALSDYRQALQAARLRTAEMIDHALDASQAQALVAQLETLCAGAQAQCRPLSQAEGLLGWGMEMAGV